MGSDSRGHLFAEYTSGKRIAGIVNALTGIFYKAGMALGGVVPGAVLAWTGYQAAAAQESNSLPIDGNAWFVAMLIYALVGFALWYSALPRPRSVW